MTSSYTAGPNYPTIAVSDGSGSIAWTNTSNVFVHDGSYASAGFGSGQTSDRLQVTGFFFGCLEASDIYGSISGIQVDIYMYVQASHGTINQTTVMLLKNGTLTGYNRTTGGAISSSASYVSFGGSSDLWGWSPGPNGQDLARTNFGVAFAGTSTNGKNDGGTLYVDDIRITVWYTVNGPSLVPLSITRSLKPSISLQGFQGINRRDRPMTGCFLFNEGTGSTVNNLVKINHTGTLSAGTTWGKGQFGPCIDFGNGNGNVNQNYIDLGSVNLLDDSKPFTISWWEYAHPNQLRYPSIMSLGVVNSASGNDLTILLTNAGSNGSQYMELLWGGPNTNFATNNFYSGFVGNANAYGDGSFPSLSDRIGCWHHFVLVGYTTPHDQSVGNYMAYCDGLVQAQPGSYGAFTAINVNRIGYDTNDNSPGKMIDLVYIWQTPLTNEEIWRLYTDPLWPVTTKSLAAPKISYFTPVPSVGLFLGGLSMMGCGR